MNASKLIGLVCVGVALAACGDEQDELRSWMDQQRAATPVIKDTIPAPKKFQPFRYENTALADPFSQSKLALAVAQAAPAKGNGLKPDAARRRETLESFPLDNIKMVGHMTNGRNDFALLQVEAMVYQARVGNYAGQNFGRIVRVTESEVTLKELVQDAAGDWVERDSALRLQEGRK